MNIRAVFMTLAIFLVIGSIAFFGLLGAAWFLQDGQDLYC